MKENTGIIKFKGNPLTLLGEGVKVGDKALDFEVLDNNLNSVKTSDFLGKINILCTIPSLDTPVCDIEMKKFNDKAATLSSDVKIYAISMDLPFAQKRWCGANEVEGVKALSDHRDASFGISFGVLIKELRLLARAIFILDKDGIIKYKQIVEETTSEPDYKAVLEAVKTLV